MRRVCGRIIKSVGGFYDVETAEGVFSCKARGIFRNRGTSPVTGDYAEITLAEGAEPVIEKISERRNHIIRPPLANIDIALLVASTCEPAPNAFVIDKLIAIFESKDIETVLVFTKKDIGDCSELINTYENAGYKVFSVDNMSGEGLSELKEYVSGKTCALIGNSGVGKSSLINGFFPELNKETAEISKKLGRGKHTTREVCMYPCCGGYIADTPGFSTVDIERYGRIERREIRYCFTEFRRYEKDCRFNDCLHLKEADCAVAAAAARGEIGKSRYESYVRMCAEAQAAEKKW